MSGNPLGAIDPLGLFQATPGTPLYEALVRAGAIAAADGPEPYYADVAAIAYLGGFALAMGIDLLLNDSYANVVEQSDFDFIVSEIQLYKPSYTYDTSTLWSPNWENYFDLLDELYETQLGYVETAENSICAPEYAPYSEELLERARSGIGFTSGIDGILNQNDDLIDQQLENAYEDYRAEGGDLTYEDWVSQGMPSVGESEAYIPTRRHLAPNRRHYLNNISQRTPPHGDVNTIIMPNVNVVDDVAAINDGQAYRRGNDIHVNGRVYREHTETGRLIPIRGEGFIQATRAQYRTVGVYRTFVDDLVRAEEILDNMGISEEDRSFAREILRF